MRFQYVESIEMQAVRARLVKMKIENPGMRFRLESNGITRERVTTATVGECGLEAPEVYFVELDVYERANGKANPDDIVFEETETSNGNKVAGVTR